MTPGSVPPTERHSAPGSAATPFVIGLMFALAAGLALWALILLVVRWVA